MMNIWSNEQVKNLEARQKVEYMHPYTCECGENLIPTQEGWICGHCNYTQDWAYELDLNGA